ncbi:hypothetical protein GCM10023196_020840 [Actinoallomurus vinaceus]|uniref:Uncharacterized protein n=1 Tax=Actinoallomurus vinaceus TaxID=1080074 RepID=A0ABP8U9D5_9ACTN
MPTMAAETVAAHAAETTRRGSFIDSPDWGTEARLTQAPKPRFEEEPKSANFMTDSVVDS